MAIDKSPKRSICWFVHLVLMFIHLSDEEPFWVKDVEAETKWNFDLRQSVQFQVSSGIFHNSAFYLKKQPIDLDQIVLGAGGEVCRKIKEPC